MAQNGEFDVIVHGCNCFHTMGGGIALQIKKAFPDAYRADLYTPHGSPFKLGTYSKAVIGELTVVNAYTQYTFDRGNDVEYCAVYNVFKQIAQDFPFSRIGIPCIGAGLAGGDWKLLSHIIEEAIRTVGKGELDLTVVEFKP